VASETSLSAGLAGRYANALYELAHDAGQLDAVAGDLALLKALIAESADLRRLIGSPLVARAQQAKAMAALVEKAGLGDLARRFVGVIAKNRRLAALPAAIDAFTALLALRRGETVAEIVSARPLTPSQADAVGAAVRGAAGRKVTLDLKVDPRLIGGLKVKVGSRLVDASLAAKLSRLQIAMKGLR
jgi:F-type H+-transporting ATPase subunit delta